MILRVTKKAARTPGGANSAPYQFPDAYVFTIYLFWFIPIFRFRRAPR